MDRLFAYPADVVADMRRERRRRRVLWGALVLLIAAAGFAVERPGWIAPAVVIGFALLLGFFELLLERFARATARVADHLLEVDGNLLRQRDRNGRVVGEVDLSDAFKVTYPYYAAGNAFYTVRGRLGTVEFSSRIADGEILVRKVLRQGEWPPGANAT